MSQEQTFNQYDDEDKDMILISDETFNLINSTSRKMGIDAGKFIDIFIRIIAKRLDDLMEG